MEITMTTVAIPEIQISVSMERKPEESHLKAVKGDGTTVELGEPETIQHRPGIPQPDPEYGSSLEKVKLKNSGEENLPDGARDANRIETPSSTEFSAGILDSRNDDVTPFYRGRSYSIDSSSEEKEEEKEDNKEESKEIPKGRITTKSPIRTTKSSTMKPRRYNPVPTERAMGEESSGVGAIANVFSNIFQVDKLKKLLGFTPDCLNGGSKTTAGKCVCPKYFRGELCQEMLCINNGTRVKVTKHVPAEHVCKCPYPEYISGAHCENVKCMNGGLPLENGYCKCLDKWYEGRFCESYTASWGAVLGVPLVCIVIVIICCVVCRLNMFPRKQTRQRRPRTRSSTQTRTERQPIFISRRGEEAMRTQENLLNEANTDPTRRPRPDPSHVMRLDTIPVFNPRMIAGIADDQEIKPTDPPPPYDQVMSAPRPNYSSANTGTNHGEPPAYTPRAGQNAYPPPPPSFRPPDAPREG